jgi:hypothetical protein
MALRRTTRQVFREESESSGNDITHPAFLTAARLRRLLSKATQPHHSYCIATMDTQSHSILMTDLRFAFTSDPDLRTVTDSMLRLIDMRGQVSTATIGGSGAIERFMWLRTRALLMFS